MRAYNGFKAEKASGARAILPAGAYVCKVLSAKEETTDWGNRLVLAIDVDEGEYAGFFRRDYDSNDHEDKKWRGTYRLSIPADDGSEQDAWKKRAFNNFIYAVQESNPGYGWNWDEKALKGKKLGVLYRDKEWEMNGNTGWTTEAAGSASVEDVRAGNVKPLKPRPLKNRPDTQTASSSSGFAELESSEDELPF